MMVTAAKISENPVCRYISNLRAAEKVKKPNVKWWGKTLKPLRTAEVQATANHLARQQEAPAERNLTQAVAPSAGSPEPSTALSSKPSRSLQKLKQEVSRRSTGRKAFQDEWTIGVKINSVLKENSISKTLNPITGLSKHPSEC